MLGSLPAQEVQWREFESMGFDRYNHPLIKVTQEGKQYFYHLDSAILIDKTENRAADMTVAIKDGRYGVIRDDGSLIVPFEYDGVELANEYYGQWYEGIPYDYRFVILQKNSRYGIADADGRVVVPPQYTAINVISKHIIGFKEDNQWGWIDAQSGQVLQPPAYDEIDGFFNDDHVRIRQNGKAGLARKEGTLIIPPKHQGALRYVSTKNARYILATGTPSETGQHEGVSLLYDLLGNVRLTDYGRLSTMHHAGFLKFEKDGLVGAVNPLTGEVVIDPVYERIEDGVRGRFMVKKETGFGVLDENGHVVVPPIYSDVTFIDVDNRAKSSSIPMIDGYTAPPLPQDERQVALREYREFLDSQVYFIRVATANGVGIFDWQGNEIVPAETYDNIVLTFHTSAFFFVRNKENLNLVILDADGEKLVELPYELDRTYRYNKSAIENDWELRNRFVSMQQPGSDGSLETRICLYDLEKAKMVVSMANQRIEWLDERFFKVRAQGDGGDEVSLFNRDGELIIAFSEPVDDLFVVGENHLLLKADRMYRLVDMHGKPLYQNPQWREGSGFAARRFPEFKDKKTGVFHHGLMKLYTREPNVFLNEDGDEIRFDAYVDVDEFYTGTALATREVPDSTNYRGYGYRYGLIDREGNEIHPVEWEQVSAFSENSDFLIVTKNEKQGLADRLGNYVLEPMYDYIELSSSYSNLQIKKDGKSGLIAKDGSMIIAPQYDELRRNYEGEDRTWPLLVKESDWYYFIDKEGNPLPVRSKTYSY